jgi:hypothetical protein
MTYELWYAPTLLGQRSFGWKHNLKCVYDELKLEDAQMDCYILNTDSLTPDGHDYEQYILIGPV